MIGGVRATETSVVQAERFAETPWSVVLAAGATSTPRADAALAALCRIYWPPIYAHLRRRGYEVQDAQDLTQSFFQHIIEDETLCRACRGKGRFRSFLLGALKLCLADEHARRQSLKRGGGVQFISVDDLEAEEQHHQRLGGELSPDELLDARWAGLVLDRALEALRTDFAASGKLETFEVLSPLITGEKGDVSYESAAARLGIGLGAAKSLIHRLRRQFATTLRREIMQTVSAPHEVDDELRALRMVFSRAAERQIA
ncbi:MAG: RNA polymerase sigma factor [Chthoniobacterales bacterium]